MTSQHAGGSGGRPAVPRRAVIVSADIGEGHNSAARALEEAMGRAWPGCEVRWLDALAAMGPGFAPLARGFYASQVQRLPWMYEFFFSAMWRHRWYLDVTRRGLGSWFGRRMAGPVSTFGPDVVVSTYPLGSAGLSWLRRRGQLSMPAGAWVPTSAFKAGRLIAPVLAIITALDPLISIGIARGMAGRVVRQLAAGPGR